MTANFVNQIVVLVMLFFCFIFLYHAFMNGIAAYQLNKSAYKKRKKGQSFKEWLFLSRFKEEIPRFAYGVYYFLIATHTLTVIVCLIMEIIKLPARETIGYFIVICVIAFDVLLSLVITLLFRRYNTKYGFAYERWITKKRGQKKQNQK